MAHPAEPTMRRLAAEYDNTSDRWTEAWGFDPTRSSFEQKERGAVLPSAAARARDQQHRPSGDATELDRRRKATLSHAKN
jgi:hypothetical protein